MQLRKLTAEMSVSPQITASDLPAIQTAGFRSIICNRPDGEGSDLPTFSEIEAAARTHGIEACYLPIEFGRVDDAAQAQFGELMRTIDKPVLAYCRTRIRATRLWSLLAASTQSPAEIPPPLPIMAFQYRSVLTRQISGQLKPKRAPLSRPAAGIPM